MNKREWMLHTISLVYGSGARLQEGVNLPDFFSNMYDAICAASPETPHEGAWVEHDGDVSTAPHVDNTTEVVFRDGSIDIGMAGDFVWDHDGTKDDIVRWRYA